MIFLSIKNQSSLYLSIPVFSCLNIILQYFIYKCFPSFEFYASEKYFDMKKNQCKEGLDIYKKFLARMTKLSEFLKVAEVNKPRSIIRVSFSSLYWYRNKCIKLQFSLHKLLHKSSIFVMVMVIELKKIS